MEGASTRTEPESGVMLLLYCCHLELTKEPLRVPLLSQSGGWDGDSLLGTAGPLSRAFFGGLCSNKSKSFLCASLKLYTVKGTYLSHADSPPQRGNGVLTVPGGLRGGK